MKLWQRFQQHVETRVDGTGLALFRIAYTTVLLAEVIQLFYFRNLIFDRFPFQVPYELNFSYALLAWMLVLVCLVVGFKTRFSAIANYLMSLVFLGTIDQFEYHMMYAYMGLNFTMLFLPLNRRLSVDNLVLRWRLGRRLDPGHYRVSKFAMTWPLFLGVGLVYLDSVLWKGTSSTWMAGLGLWKPASMANFSHVTQQWLLNLEWLMKFLGYTTVAFEAVFIFVFWFRRIRLLLFFVGLGLHLGILVFFPVPWFALGVIALYLLLIPSDIWSRIRQVFASRQDVVQVEFDPDNTRHTRACALLEHFDIFGRFEFGPGGRFRVKESTDAEAVRIAMKAVAGPIGSNLADKIWRKCEAPPQLNQHKVVFLGTYDWAKYALVLMVFGFAIMQLNSSSFSPWGMELRQKIGISHSGPIAVASAGLLEVSRDLFGITQHPVFMDSHYAGYQHVVALMWEGKNGEYIWLPIIDADGSPGWYAYGANWVNFTFRVNRGHIDQNRLIEGLRRYAAFWAAKNEIPMGSGVFHVMVKPVELPTHWEMDFLERQRARDWVNAGMIHWTRGMPAEVEDIESIPTP